MTHTNEAPILPGRFSLNKRNLATRLNLSIGAWRAAIDSVVDRGCLWIAALRYRKIAIGKIEIIYQKNLSHQSAVLLFCAGLVEQTTHN